MAASLVLMLWGGEESVPSHIDMVLVVMTKAARVTTAMEYERSFQHMKCFELNVGDT